MSKHLVEVDDEQYQWLKQRSVQVARSHGLRQYPISYIVANAIGLYASTVEPPSIGSELPVIDVTFEDVPIRMDLVVQR